MQTVKEFLESGCTSHILFYLFNLDNRPHLEFLISHTLYSESRRSFDTACSCMRSRQMYNRCRRLGTEYQQNSWHGSECTAFSAAITRVSWSEELFQVQGTALEEDLIRTCETIRVISLS